MQLSSEVDHHLEIPGVAQHGAGLYSFKFHSNLCQQSVSHDAESTIGFSVSYTKSPASPSPFLVSRICIVAEKLSKFHGTGTTHRTDRKFPCAKTVWKIFSIGVRVHERNAFHSIRRRAYKVNEITWTPIRALPRSLTSAHEWLNVRSLLPHRNSFPFRFNRNI